MHFTTTFTVLAVLSSAMSHPTAQVPAQHNCTDTVQTMPTHRNTTNHSLGVGIMHPVGCCCSQCVRRTVLVRHDGHDQALPDEYNCTKIDHHPPGCCCSHCLCKHPADCTCSTCNAQRPHGHNCTGHNNPSLVGDNNSDTNITLSHKTIGHAVLTDTYIPDHPQSRNKTIAAISIAAAAFSLVAIFTIIFVCVKRRRSLAKASAKGKGKDKATEMDRLAVRVEGDCELAQPVFTMVEVRGWTRSVPLMRERSGVDLGSRV